MIPSQVLPASPGVRFTASEHTMTLPDGVELFYRAWLPAAPTEKSLVIFHRGHEHSGRVQDIVEALDLADVAVFAWDARGHGRTPGERGYAPHFATMVKDVDCFVRHLAETFGKRPENMVVLAQSVGAVTVAAWVHDYAPRIRAMVLAAPALAIKLYVPAAIPGLRLLLKMRKDRKTFIKSYVKAKMLTHDPEQARRYDEDSLIARAIAANVLVDLHDTAARLIDDAAAIRVPTLLLAAGADWVVKLGPQRKLFERLGTPIKRMKVFAGMYHDLLHEKDRRQVIDEARQFIVEAFAREAVPPPLLDADRYGFTRNEYDRLSEPLPWCSPRGLGFRLQRLGMQDAGPAQPRRAAGLADGLRLGPDPRLRLRKPAAGRTGRGQVDRSRLSQQHRLARHPPAENEPGKAAAGGDRPRPHRRPSRAACSTSPPGRAATSWKRSAIWPATTSRPCSATTSRPTWTPAASWPPTRDWTT